MLITSNIYDIFELQVGISMISINIPNPIFYDFYR